MKITKFLNKIVYEKKLNHCCLFNESLAKYNSFRIGGAAEALFLPDTQEEFKQIIEIAKVLEIDPLVIGGGSNLIIANDIVPIVICTRRLNKFFIEGNRVYTEAGASLPYTIKQTIKNGKKGFEVLSGIPGTVGGALVGNAGVKIDNIRYEIGDITESVKVLTKDGSIKCLQKESLKFEYRNSNLKEYVVLSAEFNVEDYDVASLVSTCQSLILDKKEKQPINYSSAGCIFKNPPGTSAWKLIRQAGLHGTKVGAAMVSEKHSNFIVNLGGACARDVINLIHLIRNRVRQFSGIDLILEVKLWDIEHQPVCKGA